MTTFENKLHSSYCDGILYEKNRYESTVGTHIEIRCSKCAYFDHITIPLDFQGTIMEC